MSCKFAVEVNSGLTVFLEKVLKVFVSQEKCSKGISLLDIKVTFLQKNCVGDTFQKGQIFSHH